MCDYKHFPHIITCFISEFYAICYCVINIAKDITNHFAKQSFVGDMAEEMIKSCTQDLERVFR
jgi:hypothetical protein